MNDIGAYTTALDHLIVWCCQVTSHYLSQCWPASLSPYIINRSQWLKLPIILRVASLVLVHLYLYNFPNFIEGILITKGEISWFLAKKQKKQKAQIIFWYKRLWNRAILFIVQAINVNCYMWIICLIITKNVTKFIKLEMCSLNTWSHCI